MSGLDGKLDVLELARAQLDFSAVNAGAPSARDVLMRAQTIVPLAPQIRWERVGKAAGGAALALALLAVPWVPQQTVFSIAALQFEQPLDAAKAQEMVNHAVLNLSGAGRQALLSADYAPQESGGGLLELRASAIGQRSATLQRQMEGLFAGDGAGGYTSYPVAEYKHSYRRSPLQLLVGWAQGRASARQPDAALLAGRLTTTAPLLRQELTADLLKHGYQVSAFAFTAKDAAPPPGTNFTIDAWPRSAAVGIKAYTGLSAYQQREAQQLTEAWLKRVGLREHGLQLAAATADESLPVTVEVVDRDGRVDPLLTARLAAKLQQPTPQDLSEISFDLDPVIASAANAALPGMLRRVEFERVSPMGTPARYKARVYLLRRAETTGDDTSGRPDPVEDSNVREEW